MAISVPQQHSKHPTAASRLKARAKALLPIVLVAVGSMSPQYAEKICGGDITQFLVEAPFLAGAVAQIFWASLFIQIAALSRRAHAVPFRRRASSTLCLALPLGVLIIVVHWLWYASIARTNSPTNLILWNTDTVTTPLVALLIMRKKPSARSMVAGMLGLAGAAVAVGAYTHGNTILGCSACFVASLGYACNAVIAEGRKDPASVTIPLLLAMEGAVALLVLAVATVALALISPVQLKAWQSALPHIGWVTFIGINSVLLNIGWLWSIEISGSFWTALAACGTVPLAIMLDLLLFGQVPSIFAVLGNLMFFVGFLLGSSDAHPEEHDSCQMPVESA